MFDDFSKDETSPDAKKRLRGSILGAALVYTVSGAALVAATATARQVVEEKLTQVEFAPPPPEPEPEPEPPKIEEAPKPAVSPRPKMKRAVIEPPKEVPLEKLKESDAELVAAGDTGPVDGFLDGVEGGKGSARVAPPPPPPPPPKPAKITPPVELDNPQPKYPKAAERRGIEGVVVVSFEVLEDGRCVSPKIVSGPEEFHETVLKAVAGWRYRPAMQDGKKIRKRTTKRVVFQLT